MPGLRRICTLHSMLYNFCPILFGLYFLLYNVRFTLSAWHFLLYTLYSPGARTRRNSRQAWQYTVLYTIYSLKDYSVCSMDSILVISSACWWDLSSTLCFPRRFPTPRLSPSIRLLHLFCTSLTPTSCFAALRTLLALSQDSSQEVLTM